VFRYSKNNVSSFRRQSAIELMCTPPFGIKYPVHFIFIRQAQVSVKP